MPKRRAVSNSSTGDHPFPDPNTQYVGDDPQYGHVSDLLPGEKRMTGVHKFQSKNTIGYNWSRLTFSFPECLGIRETLENKSKSTACIPSLNMKVDIDVPVIKRVHFQWVKRPNQYHTTFTYAGNILVPIVRESGVCFILTGDDQLVGKIPDMWDEAKEWDKQSDFQRMACSDSIWGYCEDPPMPKQMVNDMTTVMNASGSPGVKIGADDDINDSSYGSIVSAAMTRAEALDHEFTPVYTNNIPKKGYQLWKDHVNLFVRVPISGSGPMEFRFTIDYETKKVPLQNILIWREQYKDFVPKQIQWRGATQQPTPQANYWDFLLSRGVVRETATGTDPDDATAFPNIDD